MGEEDGQGGLIYETLGLIGHCHAALMITPSLFKVLGPSESLSGFRYYFD